MISFPAVPACPACPAVPAVPAFQNQPVIVKIIEPNRDPTGLADVLIGSLGLTGVMVLIAVIAAAIFGAILFWMRSRKPYDHYE
jgi:hypothetical protein